jgi:hypothetical protein
MFGRHRFAILRHNLESWFVWDKKNKTGRFPMGISFAYEWRENCDPPGNRSQEKWKNPDSTSGFSFFLQNP